VNGYNWDEDRIIWLCERYTVPYTPTTSLTSLKPLNKHERSAMLETAANLTGLDTRKFY